MQPLKVLVIEDDPDTRANLCDILELDEHQVDTAATAAQALDRTNWADYSAVILDRLLPDGDAEELLPRLKALAPDAARNMTHPADAPAATTSNCGASSSGLFPASASRCSAHTPSRIIGGVCGTITRSRA